MSRTKHLHIMYLVVLATMLTSVFTNAVIYYGEGWIYWLGGSVAACVGIVAMLLYRKKWAHIMLSVCAGLLCGDALAVYIVYGFIYNGFIGTLYAVCGIISAVGIASFYFVGYIRKTETAVDVKLCASYAIAVAVMLAVGRLMFSGYAFPHYNYYWDNISFYSGAIQRPLEIFTLLAELAAVSFIVVCDKPFAKYYAVVAVAFAGIMYIVNHISNGFQSYETTFAYIALRLPIVATAVAFGCHTLIKKPTDAQTKQAQTPIKSETDLELERLEELKNKGILDDEEYKNEVIKLIGGK